MYLNKQQHQQNSVIWIITIIPKWKSLLFWKIALDFISEMQIKQQWCKNCFKIYGFSSMPPQYIKELTSML